MARRWAGLLWILCGACGADPSPACQGYVDAADACFDEAEAAELDVDVERTDADTFCLELFPDVSDARWTCEAAAYEAGDCSTDAGLAAVTDARDACTE